MTTRPLRLDAVRPEYHRATLHWRPGADGTAGEQTARIGADPGASDTCHAAATLCVTPNVEEKVLLYRTKH